jgi:N-methylhydantoinase A
MRRILVPPQPGAFSALGLLCTDVVHDYVRSELRLLSDVSAAHAEQIFRELEGKARQELEAEDMDSDAGSFARELDLRYSGQGYELRTPLAGLLTGEITPQTLLAARERFDERHAQLHGHAASERPVEVVSYRLRLRLPVPKYEPRTGTTARSAQRGDNAIKGKRAIFLYGATAEATLYDRARLLLGAELEGPAVVEQFDATTVVPAGWRARVDSYGNLIITAI